MYCCLTTWQKYVRCLFPAKKVSLTCTVCAVLYRCDGDFSAESLHKSRLRFYKSKSSFHKSGTCFYKSPSCETKSGGVHASREFVKVNQYFVKISRRDVRSTFRLLYNMARAHIFIRSYCSEKAFTRSPVARFPLIYMDFACEGLRRKAFTPPASSCEHFTPQSFTPETAGNQRFT